MSDKPIRLKILEALTETLSVVSRTNPYTYNLENAVFRGRTDFGEGDPLPMLSILETPIPAEEWVSPDTSGYTAGPFDLLIQGFVKDDPRNPTDPAYYLMADVKRAIAAQAKRRGPTPDKRNILGLGSSIIDIKIHSGTVRPADEYSSQANFWLRITVEFVEDNDDLVV